MHTIKEQTDLQLLVEVIARLQESIPKSRVTFYVKERWLVSIRIEDGVYGLEHTIPVDRLDSKTLPRQYAVCMELWKAMLAEYRT